MKTATPLSSQFLQRLNLKRQSKRSKKTNILLITATITPKNNASNLARKDPLVRLLDYQKAFKFYLTLLDGSVDYIVFAENSNSDLSSLYQLVEEAHAVDRVELMSFDGLDYPQKYSRSHGEFKLVDYAMQTSKFINAGYAQTTIWKITGRYIGQNLAQIIRKQPESFDIYCNYRNLPVRLVDQYLIAWTLEGYQKLIKGIYCEFKEDVQGRYGERVMRDLFDAASNVQIIKRMNTVPFIKGVRGWDGDPYDGLKNRWKFFVRSVTNKLLPFLWL